MEENQNKIPTIKATWEEGEKAWQFANTKKGYWRISNSPILNRSLGSQTFRRTIYIPLKYW
jgi:RNA-directed DNA polymerase